MMIQMRAILILGVVVAAAISCAQSISSFQLAQINGVTTNQVGNNITVSVSAAPTLVFNSVSYNIIEVFGVWALDDNDDMAATGVNQNGWTWDTNFSGTGGIGGWKTNPNAGLTPGQSLGFAYTSLTGTAEDFGYHIRVGGEFPFGGNTAYFRDSPVPEPASMIAMGLGAVAMIRRRRK